MSRKPTHAITDTDFGDTIELKVRLTQQQFHCLRDLTLNGLAQDFSDSDWLLIHQLEALGLIKTPEDNEEYIYPTGLYEAFRSHIIDYTELFSKTSSSVSLNVPDDFLDVIPQGEECMLLYRPDDLPGYSDWKLLPLSHQHDSPPILLPPDLNLDFFIRNGIHIIRREGHELYGRRFRQEQSYRLHFHLWH